MEPYQAVILFVLVVAVVGVVIWLIAKRDGPDGTIALQPNGCIPGESPSNGFCPPHIVQRKFFGPEVYMIQGDSQTFGSRTAVRASCASNASCWGIINASGNEGLGIRVGPNSDTEGQLPKGQYAMLGNANPGSFKMLPNDAVDSFTFAIKAAGPP